MLRGKPGVEAQPVARAARARRESRRAFIVRADTAGPSEFHARGAVQRATGVTSIDEPHVAADASRVKTIAVPLMIATSGLFMAVAWLGHLRIREKGFFVALALSWAIVLPEYILNVAATRLGYGTFTGAQMGAMHLCSGVCCVALVSRFVLGERLGWQQLVGLALLAAGMVLLLSRTHRAA